MRSLDFSTVPLMRLSALISSSVADLFIHLYNAIISNPATGHGREGFYNAINGEESFYTIGEAIAKSLIELGKVQSPKPTAFTDEEKNEYLGGVSLQ